MDGSWGCCQGALPLTEIRGAWPLGCKSGAGKKGVNIDRLALNNVNTKQVFYMEAG